MSECSYTEKCLTWYREHSCPSQAFNVCSNGDTHQGI